jgi:uncharacterized repeat protein (TIGR03803 family)
MNKLSWTRGVYTLILLCAVGVATLPAQDGVTFTVLHSFDSTHNSGPEGALTQGTDGNLYGTKYADGVFKITPSGTLTSLYEFCSKPGCTDGDGPVAALIQAADGDFYGTTAYGGVYINCVSGGGCGTVYKITAGGTLTTLHSFDLADGSHPDAPLIQATNGNLYGTTIEGGANGGNGVCPTNCGTVFKITPSGTLTTLYNFCSRSGCTDGDFPEGALLQAADGNFYGTTNSGGANASQCNGYGCGTVFKITPSGRLTTLYRFCSQSACSDGAAPDGALIQGTDGNFYGTTDAGGIGYGTVFKITPDSTLTILYSFCHESGCPDGEFPQAALVQGTDGNFYSTTTGGGAIGYGTIFKITPTGVLTTLHSFDNTDGSQPLSGVVEATNGKFYGTAYFGGGSECAQGCGPVFGLSVGLPHFVETEPAGGKVGAAVKILGTDLVGATSVTFNGVSATFSVESASYIKATVPVGATSGAVQVVTPSGTLSSNVEFRVAP